MKKTALFITCFFIAPTANANDIADSCEVVTMELNVSNTTQDNARAAKFHTSENIIESIYDDKDGFITAIDGNPVLAMLCTRESLVPTMRDLPLIKTGLPLSLSQDFDNPISGLLTIYDDGTAYKADYTGPDSLAPNASELNDVMEIFNFQRLTK